ncbi:acyl-CoA dehydrogenase family protein [Bordetella hinzii]|uniref:hydroxylase n=1 Tax=Bordetella hinzii TaxID=103855 RepID=UPI000459A853|nr:hydroxylase [Bordetella hinzii]KCB46398.1 acyl-CoA dehydrogenase, C-terminal domain protein [Bordetella hinzii 4161]KXA74100.1 hydroxylase [Bordetella hinzii LMG 13501]QDJ39636.1 hydroxylase [Bordetella hinzii]VEH25576.1 pigment production hydroxylase [Bordetella hinzii]
MHPVVQGLQSLGDKVANEVDASERRGSLTDEAARLLREAGVIRMLQPKDFGGDEAHPREFFEVLMELAARAPSIGWVGGVVGVHPFEFAQADRRVQEEVWGKDKDTWIASPYAFIGRAKRVDGGFVLSGQWPFSSGTDHCDWVVLGGRAEKLGGPADEFTEPYHFMLPRADYEILQDSWQVMGLAGTGSKDVVVKGAFVPDYRTLEVGRLNSRDYASKNRPDSMLYQVPFDLLFPGAIAAATVGIADGVVRRFSEYSRDRVSRMGIKATQNPYHMSDLGASIADIDAARLQILTDITEAYEVAARGERVTSAMQARARVHQVRAVHRAAEAAARVFKSAGGNANRLSNPIQRQWRDLAVALGHACNVEDPVYAAFAGSLYGIPAPAGVII